VLAPVLTSVLQRVGLLPNPAILRINEIAFAFTTADTLFHLRSQEYFKRATELDEGGNVLEQTQIIGDVMARCCRNILRQRCFYPLFPSVMGPGVEPLNLDITHMELLKFEDTPFDILVLPSMLKHFAKVGIPSMFHPRPILM
jgi:DNA polymerase alpha subunit B